MFIDDNTDIMGAFTGDNGTSLVTCVEVPVDTSCYGASSQVSIANWAITTVC